MFVLNFHGWPRQRKFNSTKKIVREFFLHENIPNLRYMADSKINLFSVLPALSTASTLLTAGAQIHLNTLQCLTTNLDDRGMHLLSRVYSTACKTTCTVPLELATGRAVACEHATLEESRYYYMYCTYLIALHMLL